MEPNSANMCINCIRSRVDITEGIPKHLSVYFCRNCERYLNPPNQWLPCALESKELLSLLLKKIKGLSKVRLIDAGFLWTEPHSKRIKMKLTIQKEAFSSTILQQVFVVETVVCNQQCSDCSKVMAKNTWKAVAQVRQKVDHKKTFLYLEQLILKHNAQKDCINIKERPDGLDFFYLTKGHAVKMLEFLQTVAPVRYKTSEQLISEDIQSGTANYKFTFSIEIVPVCRNDLVCLPVKAAQYLGNMNRICLCYKVGNSIHFIDPQSLQMSELSASVYWRFPFSSLMTFKDLVEFYVLDVDHDSVRKGKHLLADVVVARTCDFGKNTQTFHTRTHLGNILKPGDLVLGFDLSTGNFNDDNFSEISSEQVPDIVLVKKKYEKKRGRIWKLKALQKEQEEAPKKVEEVKAANDYEHFLQDLEEDAELRAAVNLYKDPEALTRKAFEETEESSMGDDFDGNKVALEELLDDLKLTDEEEKHFE